MSKQRLIDANALINRIVFHTDWTTDEKEAFEDEINAEPTIEERKTGKWIWKTLDVYKCSECETETHVDECMEEPIYNFCPYCGVRMAQEGEDNERT